MATDRRRIRSRLRPVVTRLGAEARQRRARVDNVEVRAARHLARRISQAPFDVLQLGDSVAVFAADYDTDARPLHVMLHDGFGPDASVHAIHGAGYNPLIFNRYVRFLEGAATPPLVVLPLNPRLSTLPWVEHPHYGHQRAIRFLSTVDATTPSRKIRAGFAPLTSEDFDRFYELRFPTWAGDLTIGDYVHPLKGSDLDDATAAKLLYAYHHGGEVMSGAPLDAMHEMGQRLRRAGAPVVIYQSPVPVEKGVELHGQAFHDLATRNFAALEDAFVSAYGDVTVVRTGLTAPTSHFIDWRDGTEHLNELGRSTVANAVVEAGIALRG